MKTKPTTAKPANAAQRPPGWRFYLLLLTVCLTAFLMAAATARAASPVDIVVTGVEGDALKNVLNALILPPGLIQNDKADKQWLERFARQAPSKVMTALEPFGFYRASAAISLESAGQDNYILRVAVSPGQPVILNDVHVAVRGPGASEEALKTLVSGFPLKKGDILLHQSYEEARRNLEAKANDLGYLDADYSIHEIRVNAEGTSAVITLEMDTKEKYYFSAVTIDGAPDYPNAFLNRYITVVPGSVFSNTKIAETQYLLSNSERFRIVTIDARKEEAENYRVPVRIHLTPSPTISLRPGVGYGTDTGARFALRYRDLNVFSKGHELNSNLFISEKLQGLSTTYSIPGSKNAGTFTSAQFKLQREDTDTYKNSYAALELARTISFSNTRQASVYVRLQEESYTIGQEDDTSLYVLPGIRFADNHYDNLVRPSNGFRYALDLRGTHTALGSTTKLLQIIADASYILPMPWRLSLFTGAKTGFTIVSDPLQELPPSLRFFAGGDQSVRGYAYQSLGPRDSSGEVVGGKHMLTGHVDLQRAILDDWAVSVFYNAGNAFDSFTDLRLYQAVGAGIHYFTPVGALNFFLARQIDTENPKFRVHFTVGFEF